MMKSSFLPPKDNLALQSTTFKLTINYPLPIHVDGEINPKTGFVIDFSEIESHFAPIKKKIDHNYLNDIKGLENPTSEILVKWIWENLKPKVVDLVKLILWENDVSRVEYSGN